MDKDFQKPLMCKIFNFSNDGKVIKRGHKIGQIVFLPYFIPKIKINNVPKDICLYQDRKNGFRGTERMNVAHMEKY